MSRPSRTTLDPRTFEYGAVAKQTGQWDAYFEEHDPDAAMLILSALVDRLEEPDRSAVQMCAMAGMTFQEAADWFSAVRSRPTDRRTAWRWCHRGLTTLRVWLDESPWVSAMTAGRIPPPEGEVAMSDVGTDAFEAVLSRPFRAGVADREDRHDPANVPCLPEDPPA